MMAILRTIESNTLPKAIITDGSLYTVKKYKSLCELLFFK